MLDRRHMLGGVVIAPEALKAQWIAENLAAEVRSAAARPAGNPAPWHAVERPREAELAPLAVVAAACECGPACACGPSTRHASAA